MKKVVVLLAAAIIAITVCLLFIINRGVSLRLAPVIGPTLLNVGTKEMARSIVVRLTPEFQTSDYIILGADRANILHQSLIEMMREEFKRDFGRDASLVFEVSQIRSCAIPCWIIVNPITANELSPNPLIDQYIKPAGRNYFTLSMLPFDRKVVVPDHCNSEQRVPFDCVVPLTVRETLRKMKSEQPHFIVRKYNDRDFFLLIETPPPVEIPDPASGAE